MEVFWKETLLKNFIKLKWKYLQKQPPRGVPRKRCYENMQEIYSRTHMPKCEFNKVAKLQSNFIEITLRHDVLL